jgi:predicted ATP-dependent Lon-type protease
MEMERPNVAPLSPEELQDLEKLQMMLERIIADGYVTPDELNAIKVKINANGKVQFEEIELCQKLIWSKIQSGDIEYRW